ncbi:hypothetical protein ACSLN1_26500, partial [Escherichia coli]|uniref:hypothetical protein n=1 Tax=Escherichia coli TaxID=562 RepID=UPI003EE12E73
VIVWTTFNIWVRLFTIGITTARPEVTGFFGRTTNKSFTTYLAQFYPVHEYKATSIIIDVNGETFGAGGRVTTKNGWKDVY